MPSLKRIVQAAMPPVLWNIGKDVKRRLVSSVDHFAYAPEGWDTSIAPRSRASWDAAVARQRAVYALVVTHFRSGQPISDAPDEEDSHFTTFAYVLALAARRQTTLSVLDFGANLGEFYWVGRSLVPDVELDYHCAELPPLAAAGRELNPQITWYTDDSCLDRNYDVVMFSSSLQYLRNWREILTRAAGASRSYLLLMGVATVKHVPTFVTTQRAGGVTELHTHFNRRDVVTAVESAGLRLMHEFAMGPYPPASNAPEQPLSTGWLFKRD